MIEGKPLTLERFIEHIEVRLTNLRNRARTAGRADGARLAGGIRELANLLKWIKEHADTSPAPGDDGHAPTTVDP